MTTSPDPIANDTVARGFLRTVERFGDSVALRDKQGGEAWNEWTWAEYAAEVAQVAAGLRELGVTAGDRVVLMMANRVEFHVLDIAVLMLGATPVSIYNSSSPEQIAYLVGHSGAVVGVVGDDAYLSRFAPVRDQLPSLRSLGIVDPGEGAHDFTFASLKEHGALDLAVEAANGSPDDLATVIYTSGTTGDPKGVMITNHNVVFLSDSLRQILPIPEDELHEKRVISYLPMAHIAERVVTHYLHTQRGFAVSCCPVPGQIAAYCGDVRPHLLFGVPRVWEKMYGGVQGFLAADPETAKKFDEAVAASKDIAIRRAWGTNTAEDDETWDFLDAVAFKQVRELLGLDHLMAAVSAAAPIPAELLSWYRAIGVPMSEVYGMSENTGAMTAALEKIKPGSVGVAIPGTEVRLGDDGEVLTRGPHVSPGYLNDPEKTAETFIDGWLHSGDIGEIDEDGYLKIIDRKKELIITAGGKNISPANLENALKQITIIGQAAAIGDKRPFVSALVVLDPDAAPAWARAQGIEFETMEELAQDQRVIDAVDAQLPEVMAGFNNAERVKKVLVLGDEWPADSDLLTPTSKLKRRGINQRFAAEIESIYGG
jgi:long-chain acyl-CoA synthetase